MMEIVNKYPTTIDRNMAARLAMELVPFLPEQYRDTFADENRAYHQLSTAAQRDQILGVTRVPIGPIGKIKLVLFDRDKLAEWLADPEKNRAGRPKKLDSK